MFVLEKKFVTKWRPNQNQREPLFPATLDVECPNHECRRSLVNFQITWLTNIRDIAVAKVTCGSCKTEAWLVLFNPPRTNDEEEIEQCQMFMHPAPSLSPQLPEEIAEISPHFVEIYNQAITAENLGLDQINGIAYRKALEFLLKDYLCRKHPDKSADIKKKFIGSCIKDYVDDPNIKSCVERTVWLGNDEAHYERRWKEKDIEDLKLLLRLTLYWISSEYLTEKYTSDMSKD